MPRTSTKIHALRALGVGVSLYALAHAGHVLAQTAEDTADVQAADAQQAPDEDAIVVIGVRQQLLDAIAIERNDDQLVSVLTANDAGQFPSSNIGEALERLPGVTIDTAEGEGRFIVVRGLSPNFVQVTVNGATLGSSSGVGNNPNQNRAVALNVIPTALLNRVRVEKSLLPNTDHDSLGARVDLRPLSAFERRDDATLNIRAQGNYNVNGDQLRPQVTVDGTLRRDLGNSELGIAAAFNFDEREVFSSGVVTGQERLGDFDEETGEFVVADPRFEELGPDFIYPDELDFRSDLGFRRRFGGTLTLDLNVDDRHEFQFSALYGRLRDNDFRSQYELEFGIRNLGDIEELGPGRLVSSRPRLEPQFFEQTNTEETYALHFEGKNALTDRLALTYAVDYSENDFEQIGSRLRFRSQRFRIEALSGQSGEDADFILSDPGSVTPSDININQYLRNETFFTDEIFSFNAELTYEAEIFGRFAEFSVGGKFRDRVRDISRSAANQGGNPNFFQAQNPDLPQTLADFPTEPVDTSFNLSGNLEFGFLSPSLSTLRDTVTQFENTFSLADRQIPNFAYTIDEETTSAFVQGNFELTNNLSVLTGVRYEETRFATAGSFTRQFRLDGPGIQIEGDEELGELAETVFTYDDWFPHVHVRWEPTPNTLVRASYYQSHVRPGFGAARGEQSVFIRGPLAGENSPPEAIVNIDLDNDGTTEDIDTSDDQYFVLVEGGNPFLRPTSADQIDLTFGWFPNRDLTITASLFYKDIKDQVIVVAADDSSPDGQALINNFSPVASDPLTGQPTTEFETAINGQSAELYGVELSVNHSLTYLPGILGNLFVDGNLSLLSSSQQSDVVQNGQSTRLPDQADILGNFSLGYEDRSLLLRASANYRGEQSLNFNAQFPALDIIRDDRLRFDFVSRFRVNRNLDIFFEASNIFGATEGSFARGNAASGGGVFNSFEDFGSTIQFGANLRL